MNVRLVLVAVAAAGGLLSGPASLESVVQSEPRIQWGSLTFMFVGSLVANVLVLGFQAVIGNFRALRWGWWFFLINAVYFSGAGFSSLVKSVIDNGLMPSSFVYFAIGTGSLIGLGAVRTLFAGKFNTGESVRL